MDIKKINKYIEMIDEYIEEPHSIDKEWLNFMYDIRTMLRKDVCQLSDTNSHSGKMKVVLDEGVKIPTKAYDTDAGFDLYSREDKVVKGHNSAVFDTGVHIELPKNTTGFIKSKSGLNIKHNIMSMGVVDVGYTGSITVKLYNLGSKDYKVSKGDKISQLVILPIVNLKLEQTDKLEEKGRGNNGFGSSGK